MGMGPLLTLAKHVSISKNELFIVNHDWFAQHIQLLDVELLNWLYDFYEFVLMT